MIVPDVILADLPTPCLIVDTDAADRNIERAGSYARDGNFTLRPHFKAHTR